MRSHETKAHREFLVIGILMGVAEDLIAIWLTTHEPFTLQIVVFVAVPFAAFAELVVDRADVEPFEQTLHRLDVGQTSSSGSSK